MKHRGETDVPRSNEEFKRINEVNHAADGLLQLKLGEDRHEIQLNFISAVLASSRRN